MHHYGQASDLRKPEFWGKARQNLGIAGQERYRENYHHQHFERLFKTSFRRVPLIWWGHGPPYRPNQSPRRIAAGGTYPLLVFYRKPNWTLLQPILLQLEAGRLLRTAQETESTIVRKRFSSFWVCSPLSRPCAQRPAPIQTVLEIVASGCSGGNYSSILRNFPFKLNINSKPLFNLTSYPLLSLSILVTSIFEWLVDR